MKIALHSEVAQGLAKATQNVAQPRQISRRAFRQSHATRIAAGARANAFRFEYSNAPPWSNITQARRGRESGESAADYGEINSLRERAWRWMEIDRPRRPSPSFSQHR